MVDVDLPHFDSGNYQPVDTEQLFPAQRTTHPPRILLLYGSLRERSYSRLLTEESARLLSAMGAGARIFNPAGLPMPDGSPENHPKVRELRELALWAERAWSGAHLSAMER